MESSTIQMIRQQSYASVVTYEHICYRYKMKDILQMVVISFYDICWTCGRCFPFPPLPASPTEPDQVASINQCKKATFLLKAKWWRYGNPKKQWSERRRTFLGLPERGVRRRERNRPVSREGVGLSFPLRERFISCDLCLSLNGVGYLCHSSAPNHWIKSDKDRCTVPSIFGKGVRGKTFYKGFARITFPSSQILQILRL